MAGACRTLSLTRCDNILVVMFHCFHVAGAFLVRLINTAYIVMSLGLCSHKYVTVTIRTFAAFIRWFIILVVRALIKRGLIFKLTLGKLRNYFGVGEIWNIGLWVATERLCNNRALLKTASKILSMRAEYLLSELILVFWSEAILRELLMNFCELALLVVVFSPDGILVEFPWSCLSVDFVDLLHLKTLFEGLKLIKVFLFEHLSD